MIKDMQNRALVAAAVARQSGFEETYQALLEIIRQLEKIEVSKIPEDSICSHRGDCRASCDMI